MTASQKGSDGVADRHTAIGFSLHRDHGSRRSGVLGDAQPPLAAFRLPGVALVCRRGDRFGPSLRVGTVTLSTLIAFNGAAPDAREPL